MAGKRGNRGHDANRLYAGEEFTKNVHWHAMEHCRKSHRERLRHRHIHSVPRLRRCRVGRLGDRRLHRHHHAHRHLRRPQLHPGSNNGQYSTIIDITESGYVTGYSQRFDGESSTGNRPVGRPSRHGITTRVGSLTPPYQSRRLPIRTNYRLYRAGLRWRILLSLQWIGNSRRHVLGRRPQTVPPRSPLSFQSNSATQEATSTISGITEDGLVYGNYVQYDGGDIPRPAPSSGGKISALSSSTKPSPSPWRKTAGIT